jgi:hypothetical protein
MGKFISQTDLETFFKKEANTLGKSGVKEKIDKTRSESKGNNARKTIFLSHSHLDKTIVNKIGLLFSMLNTELYVDWLDKTLPEETNKITADTIKVKIQECNHFLFLATYHGLRSKWCNWELGVADSLKKSKNLAILPIESKSGNWKGNEYLQLYPEMKFETTDFELLTVNEIKIHELDGKIISLKKWLT